MSDDASERVDFFEIFPTEVDDRDWALAYQLNDLHKRWKFFRRLKAKVRCVNPETGEMDVLFTSLVDWEEPRFPDSQVCRWAGIVDQEFFEDGLRLNGALGRAFCALNPNVYLEWVEICDAELDQEDINTLTSRAESAKRVLAEGGWGPYFHYLHQLDAAYEVLGKWQAKFDQLRNEEMLLIWKQSAVMIGASEGGRKSGRTRGQKVAATPETVAAHYAQMMAEGRSERDVAALLAARFRVSPDHIRRLRRQSKKPT
jgi:hypothetical protein